MMVDMAGVLQVISAISEARNEGTVIEAMRRGAELIGGRQSVFVSFIADDVTHESYRFLVGCEGAFCTLYRKMNWFVSDPAVMYAAHNTEPILGSELQVRQHLQQDLLDVAREHGFTSVLAVPTPSAGGVSRVGVWTVGAPVEGVFEEHFSQVRIAARAIAMEIHEWWRRQVKHELVAECGLCDDDVQLLRFEKEGKKSKDIAKLLGATPAAIDKKFGRLSKRMGVADRQEAARLAVECGLI
jgi:hypothetical protein